MSKFFWIANAPALDLANTLAADENGQEVELLLAFEDLMAWLIESGATTEAATARVSRLLDADGRRKMLELARSFRGHMKDLARTLAHQKPVPHSVVKAINQILREKEGHFELIQTSGGFERKFRPNINNVSDFLYALAESAIDLLKCEHNRIKKCQGKGCVLYFYDLSKRNTRRWCSMSACGNRAKVNAHYVRSRDI